VARSLGRDLRDIAVLQADARTVPLPAGRVPDLVFVDPPYENIPHIAAGLFARLGEKLAGNHDALVVFELPGEMSLAPPGWSLVKRLGKGARQPTVCFFRPAAGVASAAT
jgi:16S rRNA (guanine966-N2)-methyltransferase